MKSNRIMQSKIYRFLDYVLRLILLNALVVIPSFSFFIIYASLNKTTDNPLIYLSLIPLVLWMFPSIVATSSVIRQYETNDTNTIFKDFFKSLKSTYLKSLLFTIVILVCGMLLYNSVMFFANYIRNSLIHTVGLLLSVSCIAIFIIIVINIILVMSYFKGLRVIEIVKLANIMAFKDLLSNILAMFVVLIFLLLDIAIYVLMAFGGFTIPIYLVIKLTFKKYIKIYRKVEKRIRMKKRNGMKLFLCAVLTFGLTIALRSNLKAEIGDSGVVMENGEETVETLLGGVKLHEQDLKFLKDCSGNYYYEFDTQYLETQPNAEGVKIVTWSYRNEGEWKMAGVSDIAANFEKENPGWIVVGGTNADFFNINGNGAMNSNAMEMGELIHPRNIETNAMWRGILGFTKDNELITGIPEMTPHYNIHIYENDEMKDELNSVKVEAINPSTISNTGITLLTKDINQRWDLTGCKVIVGYYDVCRYNNSSGKHYFVKGTLLETRDGKADERPSAINENNDKINEFYLVSKDGSLDNFEMNSYVKIQRDYVGKYADVYNSASYYWKILDQGTVLFEGHSDAQKRQEYINQYPGCDFSYITAAKSRCLFGVKADGSYVMAVIGGSTSSGPSLSEAAYYMKEVGCVDAWDFDGGGSATLVARDEMGYIQTINVPSDAGDGTERRVGNAILMVVRDPGFNCYKKNSTETSVTFNKKTDSDVFEKMENIKITVGNITKEVASDEKNVVFENLKPDTKYKAVISYTFEGEEFSSELEVETKKFDPGYRIIPNSYGFTITRYEDNSVIRILSTVVNIDGKAYNMGTSTKFVIDDLYKDYQYTISYTYTAEIIATKETFTINVEEQKYDTLNYEVPVIKVFEENRKTDDSLRVKYEYTDADGLVLEAYLVINGKKTKIENKKGTYTFNDLDFSLNSYYVKLVVVYEVNEIEEELESDELTYEKPECTHAYDNDCDATCNLCNATREVAEHKWVDATCTKAAHCSVCGLEEGTPLEHTKVVDKGYAATCEKEGLTDGSHCSVCNKVLEEQKEIKKADHTWVDATKKAPKTCSVCGETTGEKLKGCKKASVVTILSMVTLLASTLVLLRKKR